MQNKQEIEEAKQYVESGDYDKAIEILDHLFENRSDLKEIKEALIEALFRKGGDLNDDFIADFINAANTFKRILEIDPTNYRAYYNLGIAYFNMGDYESALKAYNEALELKPDYAYCLYNMGLIHEAMKNFKIAEKYYQNALKISPNFRYAKQAIEQLRAKQDEFEKEGLSIAENEERTNRLKSLFKVAASVKIEMIKTILELDDEDLLKKLIEWCERYDFKIDGDLLILNKETLQEFLKEI